MSVLRRGAPKKEPDCRNALIRIRACKAGVRAKRTTQRAPARRSRTALGFLQGFTPAREGQAICRHGRGVTAPARLNTAQPDRGEGPLSRCNGDPGSRGGPGQQE